MASQIRKVVLAGFVSQFILSLLFCQQLQFSIKEVDDGLSKGLIKAISTDSIGFIWIATDDGVIRFDGKNSIFFKDRIKGGFAKAFCKRKNGQLLVLHDFGLTEIISLPDTTYFKPILVSNSNKTQDQLYYPKTIYEDKNGVVWIGENQSIVKFDGVNTQKFNLNINPNQGLLFRTFSFLEDGWGNLWLLSYSGQLFYYDRFNDKIIPHNLPCNISNVSDVALIQPGKCLIGTENGLYEVQFAKDRSISSCQKVPGPSNISRIKISNNKIYFGTWNEGLFQGDVQESPIQLNKITNLPYTDIVDMSIDPNNGIWVSSSEDFALMAPIFFKQFPLEIQSKDFDVQDATIIESIYLTNDNELVVLSGRELIVINSFQQQKKVSLSFLPENVVPLTSLIDDGKIFLGGINGRVFVYDESSDQLTQIEQIKESDNSIKHIYKDHIGNIWVCGNDNLGLVRIGPDGTLYDHYLSNGFGKGKMIYETENNIIYAVGDQPDSFLFLYDPTSDTFKNISTPLPFKPSLNFSIEDLIIVNENQLLLASSDGLLSYKLTQNLNSIGRIRRIDLKIVPIAEPIKALANTEDGTLWIATTSGLIAKKEKYTLLFNKSDGLPSNNLITRGLKVDQDGKVWVGTAKGIGLFNQSGKAIRKTPSPIITSLKINSVKQLLHQTQETTLPYRSNIEVDFLALSIPSERIKYQYRILNRDTNWISIPGESLLIPSPSPGDHTLQIRAQQQGGLLWSVPTNLNFAIITPWYLRWWVVTLILALFGGLVFLFARIYNYRLLKMNERLEKIIGDRTQEINRQKNEIIEQQKKIISQNEEYRLLKEKQLRDQIDYKNKQLTTYTLNIIQKNETLKELRLKIVRQMRDSSKISNSDLKSFLNLIDYSFRKDKEWEKFKLFFEEVHNDFFENLLKRHPSITPQDLRHCALIKLNLSIPETATILGISPESVKTSRSRLRKKMDLEKSTDLIDYIIKA